MPSCAPHLCLRPSTIRRPCTPNCDRQNDHMYTHPYLWAGRTDSGRTACYIGGRAKTSPTHRSQVTHQVQYAHGQSQARQKQQQDIKELTKHTTGIRQVPMRPVARKSSMNNNRTQHPKCSTNRTLGEYIHMTRAEWPDKQRSTQSLAPWRPS